MDRSLFSSHLLQFEELCLVNSSCLILCKTPAIRAPLHNARVRLEFILDNLSFDFNFLHPTPFSYEVNPVLKPLNAEDPAKPYRHKPGSVISVEVMQQMLTGTALHTHFLRQQGLCQRVQQLVPWVLTACCRQTTSAQPEPDTL